MNPSIPKMQDPLNIVTVSNYVCAHSFVAMRGKKETAVYDARLRSIGS